MKTLLKFSLLSILAIIGFTSCEDDLTGGGTGGGTGGTGGGSDASPSTGLLTETGFVDFAATVMPQEAFSVRLQADRGDSPLSVLTITEDDTTVDFSRITIDGSAASSNPIVLFDTDKENFIKDITIVSQSGESTNTYVFRVEDEAGNFSTSSVTITTEAQVVPPTILIEGSGMAMVAPNSIFSIPVTVSNVTTPLLKIGVLQDGQHIEPSRLYYDDINNEFPINPVELPDADFNGFMRTIFVRVHPDAGIRTYTIELEDISGAIYTRDLTIETGTSVTSLNGVLFNSAGPAGTGGLDLDDGMSVGSDDMRADLKDEGIDLNQPAASNWIRRISGANGAVVRHIFPGQNGLPDDFNFDNVSTSQQVASLFENGVSFVDTNIDGDPISLRVQTNDIFTVSANNTFYLIRVSGISETIDNNQDSYMMDIRF
jgi:hypothetical protein